MTEIDPKLSRLYREASTEGPPAALDAAILAAARERVAKPRRPARSSWVRWMAPASALATLVVAVSLAFLVERERPGTTEDTPIRQTSPQPDPPPARATEPSKAKAADSAEPATAATAATPAAVAAPTAPAAPAALEKKEAPAAIAPATTAPAPIARPAEAAPSAAEAFPAERRAKSSAAGSLAPKAAAESNVAGDSATGSLGAAAPAAPAAAGKLAPMRQQAAPRSPEAWLEEISRLKREGRDNEAAEQLAEFRKIYPAVSVPESLRGLQ